ncbi:MAG: tRNA (adenosine(37)-N6)-threonylcarbamoyltransferase complex ATPase subunit type 1 TsaE [Candidatus Saccharimonadales bacterium]
MEPAVFTTNSAEETSTLGEAMGKNLRGGEMIELVSDLGGGKTTLTQGLAKGFGSPDRVASPSFTISREYTAGDKRIHHFDFYRLGEAGIMLDEIAELVNDQNVVLVVEWADVVADVLPLERISIALLPVGDTARQVTITVPQKYDYIIEGIA